MPAAPFAPQTLALTATPRDYQERFIGDVFKSLDDTPEGSPALLYAAPTGTGKSVMELTLLSYLPDSVLVTPRLEIVADMLKKGGIATRRLERRQARGCGAQHRITTPDPPSATCWRQRRSAVAARRGDLG
jgi:superfamily II DNA or RNA helicase